MANHLSPARDSTNVFEWNYRRANNFFASVRYHKPVGVSRHFQMIFLLDKFIRLCKSDLSERPVPVSYDTFKPKPDMEAVTSDTLWDYLDTLYDLDTLNSNEEVPAELEEETEFSIDHDPFLVTLLHRVNHPRSANVSHAIAVATEASRQEQQAAANVVSDMDSIAGAETVGNVQSLSVADDGRSVASSSMITVSDTEARSASKSKRNADVKPPQSSAQSKRSKKR